MVIQMKCGICHAHYTQQTLLETVILHRFVLTFKDTQVISLST